MHRERIGKNISIVYRYSQVFLNPILKEYDLGSGQYTFLINLFENNGINQEKLTELVKIDKANTARAINKLVEKGYVVKKVSKEDKRAYELYTTEKAEAIRDRLNSIFDSWNEILLQGLSEAEENQLAALLDKVETNISTHFNQA
ncbi:MarR family winged helix-turn-helix transcriptional regulator [Acetobacterium wieringae]|uniref:MarR family winged helix-turn-helix transcriptional regulator n=1 Tax=Acetobacterium wieringae TaxID=52694 RepID=UPI001652722B|nr:MarR family transcriptional regulator [Acetobacterium wieringae]MEA4806760.1 MarR family transcriptional regulator [Acetobacterium wieringae]